MAIIGSFPVEDLADVELRMPVSPGQILSYDSDGKWHNKTVSGDGTDLTPLENRIYALEQQIAALEALLANYTHTVLAMSSNGTTVYKTVLAKPVNP